MVPAHGLVVDRVYQVVEYEPNPCFQRFGESVSAARRAGDSDPEKAIIADTMKLLGNSGYGKTVTNVDRHHDVKYCTEVGTSALINNKRFRQLDVVTDDAYEIEMNKSVVKCTLPLHIGFFVYQYAKLRMLQFYYDFVDRYIERPLFQYCEMDTDSAYIALAGDTIDDLVTSEHREHYFQNRSHWLPAECCDDHEEVYVCARIGYVDQMKVHSSTWTRAGNTLSRVSSPDRRVAVRLRLTATSHVLARCRSYRRHFVTIELKCSLTTRDTSISVSSMEDVGVKARLSR